MQPTLDQVPQESSDSAIDLDHRLDAVEAQLREITEQMRTSS